MNQRTFAESEIKAVLKLPEMAGSSPLFEPDRFDTKTAPLLIPRRLVD